MVYKCLECQRGVRSNSKAIECDKCKEWCHIHCGVPITLDRYNSVCQGDATFDWMCPACSADVIELHPADNSLASDEPTLPAVESTRLSFTLGIRS